MGRLTTHILDTARGCPAAEVKITLFAVTGDGQTEITSVTTDEDGRCDGPVLDGAEFAVGTYELQFHVGDYMRANGADLESPAFLDIVSIRFGIASAGEHYHVPLLISPYGYSTYRGS
jgi:5-hydroxyisourate hydrolase